MQMTLDKFQTIKKEKVYDVENQRVRDGCYGCDHCKDTGYSWVCTLTDEKLEGFDSEEDKRNNNKSNFLDVNVMVTLGKKCPFPVIKKDITKVRYDVDIETIKKFVDDETLYVYCKEINEHQLIVGVRWIEGGYHDDDCHRDWVQNELSEVTEMIENKFNVKIEDGDCELEREEYIITL